MSQLDWHGAEYIEHLTEIYSARLQLAAEMVADKQRYLTQIDCPLYHTGTGEHSPYYGPPYKETGELHDNIQVRGSGLTRQIGTTSPHGYLVEKGIGIAAPRPWAITSLVMMKDQIARVVTEGEIGGNA